MPENNTPQTVGFDVSKMIDTSAIKKELRSEITAGIIKAFVAGMVCVILGNYLYGRFAK
jgi:hypothetical protein